MNTEEAAQELAKIFKKAITECLDEVIEHRCYLVILKILNSIQKNGDKVNHENP